jgi:hypothetical protein
MSRVYDKNGHELTVGAVVEETKTGRRYQGHVDALGRVGEVAVAAVVWPGLEPVGFKYANPGRFLAVSDLLLIDSPSSNQQTTEEAASAAPGGWK